MSMAIGVTRSRNHINLTYEKHPELGTCPGKNLFSQVDLVTLYDA